MLAVFGYVVCCVSDYILGFVSLEYATADIVVHRYVEFCLLTILGHVKLINNIYYLAKLTVLPSSNK